MYIYIYIYTYIFSARDKHAPNFSCPGTECLTYTYKNYIPTKPLLRWLQNFCKLSLFLDIKLDRNKTISIFMVHS